VTTYIPWSIAKGTGLLQGEVPHQFGIHGVLEERQHVMTRIREEVSTRMPRPEETAALELRPGVPVLDVWHTGIDQDGEPYELTQFVMRRHDRPAVRRSGRIARPGEAVGASAPGTTGPDLGIGVSCGSSSRSAASPRSRSPFCGWRWARRCCSPSCWPPGDPAASARMWGHIMVAALLTNAVPYLLFAVAEQIGVCTA
jgi:hypothetical protein